jgi:fibro-slime domain-containing protein
MEVDMSHRRFVFGIALVGMVAACGSSPGSGSGFSGSPDGGPGLFGGSGDDSGGTGSFGGDGGGGDDAGPCGHVIAVTVRDFKPSTEGGHVDFERDDYEPADDMPTPGIVEQDLGPDQKPVYAPSGGTRCTTGPAEFAQWYNDTQGVNINIPITLTLTESPPGSSTYIFQVPEFFPIDGKGFGNGPAMPDGTRPHNFSFTTEVHLKFTYRGGEIFTFSGDDDVWVFINRKLAVDLGGLHPKVDGTADLDAQAAQLGITKGREYPMDMFQAERHTMDSNFNITTTIQCFTPTVPK